MTRALAMSAPRILELGTKQSTPGRSTRHTSWFPNTSEYLGTDIEEGPDVDFVADVHRLTRVTGCEQFDIILSEAGFEHFKYPHLAAHEVMKALRVGGILFIQTHQTFPIHAVPHDYFRFSREALAGLFGRQMGFNVIATAYASPAAIYSRVDPPGFKAPAFLHVQLLGEKVAHTPEHYVFEYDCLFE
jgi:SAM-dependent methyltransferase